MSNINLSESENDFKPRIDIDTLQQKIENVRNEISKIIVGQKQIIDLMLTAILSNGHILLEGVPGVAKTLTAKIVAKTLELQFSRIQFTPDLMPSDVTGTSVFNQKNSDFELHKGPIFSNIVLVDEINRSPAKTQSSLFEVMEERQVSIDGVTYKMDEPFIVVATQNPIEHEGTYRLPEAQIDRFLFKINIDYPTIEEDILILENKNKDFKYLDLNRIIPVLTRKDIAYLQELVHSVIINSELIKYIVNIIHSTRKNKNIFLGASPRAASALMSAVKAYSAIEGRDFVTPEDVRFIAPNVLRHRLLLTPDAEMDGLTTDDVISQILKSVEVPR